jgi:peptidoglycan/xylan/chitin deacetylase (PgdA/CDA1 family)
MAGFFPVLTFHDLDGRSSPISFPPRLFRRGMAKLHENGYKTLSLADVADCVRRRRRFPEQCFAITFDDGYENVYKQAFPVLQRYGMCGTVFLTVGTKEKGRTHHRLPSLMGRSMLRWNQIREMQQFGVEFGSHTLTHPDLTTLSFDRVRTEVGDSKQIIEENLRVPVAYFAYPYGSYNRKVREIVAEYHDCACTDNLDLISARSDPYAFERVDAYYLRSDQLFSVILTRFFPFYIKILSVPRWIRRLFKSKSG